ncbi:ABC transporter permease [Halomarina ordinaria]|uniref:ABC transporter permease n=1 Tax=Halomarina ordinaria TaxID=3033939 RepID=A0ABD5U755_9EURY|nr:ABC transporter permease [Halomarina sp. PSRA2]
MTLTRRVRSETTAAARSFLRRRTAVFFTFFFPVIIILIFGALVQTQPTGGGLFAEPPAYYLPGYLAVVVLFTPLSRVGSEVARHREGNRFEKLATTPLSRAEWLLSHTLVNVGIIGVAALVIFALVVLVTGANIALGPGLALVVPFVVLGVALFCGVGALLGRIADSQDGVIAASNGIAIPLLFLSETFVPPSMLPEWFVPALSLSPLSYFSRGVRAVTTPGGGDPLVDLGVLAALTAVFFVAGALALPRTD